MNELRPTYLFPFRDDNRTLFGNHLAEWARPKPTHTELDFQEFVNREQCADACLVCLDYAAKRGVFLAIENHGGITARAATLKKICDTVGPHPWFGVNLDTGNFRTDPYGDMRLVAPYAVNVQVKDWVTAPDGKTILEADLAKVVKMLRDVNYRGYLVLEYEGKEDPMTGVPCWIEKLKKAAAQV